MRKRIRQIGVQFTNSTVKIYSNYPSVELEVGHARDTSPYRVKINGDTIGCETIAKLIIDDKIYTFPDPFIEPTYQDPDWFDEKLAWRKSLGNDCFTVIEEALDSSEIISKFLDTPFTKDEEVQKKKMVIEMHISKDLYAKRKEREEAKKKREEEEKSKSKSISTGYSLNGTGTVKLTDVVSGSDWAPIRITANSLINAIEDRKDDKIIGSSAFSEDMTKDYIKKWQG